MELDNPERGSGSRTLKNIITTPGVGGEGGGQKKKNNKGKVKYNRLPTKKEKEF